MKKYIALILFLLPLCSIGQEVNFDINGRVLIDDTATYKAMLRYIENGKTINQSSEVKDGKFHFSGTANQPTIANILVTTGPDLIGTGMDRIIFWKMSQ